MFTTCWNVETPTGFEFEEIKLNTNEKKAENRLGRVVTKFLRHGKGLSVSEKINSDGSYSVDGLVKALKGSKYRHFSNGQLLKILKYAVLNNNKHRIVFSDDHNRIRCCQGHSHGIGELINRNDLYIEINDEIKYLFHATNYEALKFIMNNDNKINGLKSMERMDIHACSSKDHPCLRKVRNGVMLKISIEKLLANKNKIWQASNGVCLIEGDIPKDCLEIV